MLLKTSTTFSISSSLLTILLNNKKSYANIKYIIYTHVSHGGPNSFLYHLQIIERPFTRCDDERESIGYYINQTSVSTRFKENERCLCCEKISRAERPTNITISTTVPPLGVGKIRGASVPDMPPGFAPEVNNGKDKLQRKSVIVNLQILSRAKYCVSSD